MNIAICDDDKLFSDNTKEQIREISAKMNIVTEVQQFDNGNDMLDKHRKSCRFDVVLLDIEMPKITGLNVAELLREENDDVIIIFVSSYTSYVFDVFGYNAFRYIRKNRIKDELPLALKSAYSVYAKKIKKFVTIKTSELERKIPQSDIVYFEIVDRKMRIHLCDGDEVNIWKTIKEMMNEVDDEVFVKVHSAEVVNMKYVKQYTKDDITLDDGRVLIVSRAGMKNLKNKLTRYWGCQV